MPTGFYEIKDLKSTVERPILQDIMNHLLRNFNFPKDVGLSEKGRTGHSILAGTGLSTKSEVKWEQEDIKLAVTAVEEADDQSIHFTSHHRNHTKPFFKDKRLDISVAPVVEKTKVTVSCRYVSASLADAEYLRTQLRRAAASDALSELLEARLYYLLPNNLMSFLAHCWTLRELKFGYGGTFNDWLMDCFDSRYKVVTDSIGKNHNFAISEKRIRIIGRFDFDTDVGLAELKDEGGTRHELTFNFIYDYDKPTTLRVIHPYAIHQTPLDSKYLPDYPDLNIRLRMDLAEMAVGAMLPMDSISRSGRNENPYTIPENDLWYTPYRMPNYVPFLSLHLLLDANPVICNLNDVYETPYSTIELYDEIKDYIRANRVRVLTHGTGGFWVAIYMDDSPLNEEHIEIDEYLNVRLLHPLDPRRTYRLVISFMDKIAYNPDDIKEHIRNEPEIFSLLTEASTGQLPIFKPTPTNAVPKDVFNESIVKAVTSRPIRYENSTNMKTAAIFTVRALRKS